MPLILSSNCMRVRTLLQSQYIFRHRSIYVPIAIGALVAWVSPLDVMDRLSFLKPLAHSMAEVFPPMAMYVAVSDFPQVTELYFLLMFLHAPLHAAFAWEDARPWRNVRAKIWNSGLAGKGKLLIQASVLGPGMAFFLLLFDPGRAVVITILPIHSSRSVLGLIGWLSAGALACMLASFSGLIIAELMYDAYRCQPFNGAESRGNNADY
jgi:hypothetical protein